MSQTLNEPTTGVETLLSPLLTPQTFQTCDTDAFSGSADSNRCSSGSDGVSDADDRSYSDVVRYPLVAPEKLEITKSCFVKLMNCFPDHQMIRSFVGLGQEMYEHLKNSKINFIPPIVNDLSIQNEEDLIIDRNFVSMAKCSNHTGWTWAFLDYVLGEQTCVYQMNFRYTGRSGFDMGFGVMEVQDDLSFGDTRNAAMHCLYHCDGEISQNGSCFGNSPLRENDIVGIEVNTFDSTVRFFVNGRLQPVSLSNVPSRLRFCVAEECTSTDRYCLEDPSVKCARYMHTMKVNHIAGREDQIECVSFRRFVSSPPLLLPPGDVYDPDRFGYARRVVEWNYLKKKRR